MFMARLKSNIIMYTRTWNCWQLLSWSWYTVIQSCGIQIKINGKRERETWGPNGNSHFIHFSSFHAVRQWSCDYLERVLSKQALLGHFSLHLVCSLPFFKPLYSAELMPTAMHGSVWKKHCSNSFFFFQFWSGSSNLQLLKQKYEE